MASGAIRGCGFRKVGGPYLVGSGRGIACDRLPTELTICPTCGHGIKQARGWTWIQLPELVGGRHEECTEKGIAACPLCTDPRTIGRAGLIWIGEGFYPTPRHFMLEAAAMGISRRIPQIPRGFVVGETWVLLAHPRAVPCQSHPTVVDDVVCPLCKGTGYRAGIFYVFLPHAIEKIVTESQAADTEAMDELRRRGITPVAVPDGDRDHRGSVYDEACDAVDEGEL